MNGRECSASGTSRFNPGNNPGINRIRGNLSLSPKGKSGGFAKKSLALPGFDTEITVLINLEY
jgi:hypothetical protein